MATKLEIIEIETGNVVHTVDVSADNLVEKVVSGLLRNMDTERYYVGEAPDDDAVLDTFDYEEYRRQVMEGGS